MLAALAGDPEFSSLHPSVAHNLCNYSSRGSGVPSGLWRHCTHVAHTHAGEILTHKIKISKSLKRNPISEAGEMAPWVQIFAV